MKPTLEAFENAVAKYGGNLTKVAQSFKRSRSHIYHWINEDENFKRAVDDARMTLFDECLATARVVSLGIPEVKDGKIVGWVERPDSGMLRYLLGSLGRSEGFGERTEVELNTKEPMALSIEIIDRADQVDKSVGADE